MTDTVHTISSELTPSESIGEKLEYDESGRLSIELDEMSEQQFELLKTDISELAQDFLELEFTYEKKISPETYDAEKIKLNEKHVNVVTTLVREYAETSGVATKTARLAEIAAMLHDLQKNKPYKSEDERLLWHNFWSAELADNLLFVAGLNDADIDTIKKAIVEHQPMPFVSKALAAARSGEDFLDAVKSVPAELDLNSFFSSESAKQIKEAWEQGFYSGPSNEVSALVFCADLLSPAEVLSRQFVEDSSHFDRFETQVAEKLGDSPEYSEYVAAGSFDRYVFLNLRLGRTFKDSMESAAMSLADNIAELANDVSVLETRKDEIPPDLYKDYYQAATLMREVVSSRGAEAFVKNYQLRMTSAKNFEREKALEQQLPAEERSITLYEGTLEEYKKIRGSEDNSNGKEEIMRIREQLKLLRSDYIRKSMDILYKSAYSVYKKEQAADAP